MSLTVDSGTDQIELNQVDVLDQFSSQGCGGASCGYQALKNTIGITALAKGKGAESIKLLSDGQQAKPLFGLATKDQAAGIWRSHVIENRQRRLLRFGILKKIPLVPAQDDPGSPMRSFIDSLLIRYAEEAAEKIVHGQTVEVSFNSLCRWIQDCPPSLMHGDDLEVSDADIARAKERGTIESYVLMDQHIINQFSLAHLDQFNQEWYRATCTEGQENGYRMRLDGEWLDLLEVESLYDKLKSNYPHLTGAPLMTVISTSSQLEAAAQEIKDKIFEHKPLERDIYPFIIHTGAHYVTVVLDTTSGKRRYTIADSMHNTKRLCPGPIIDFINKLEGCNIASHIPNISHFGSFGFGRYCSCVWGRLKALF